MPVLPWLDRGEPDSGWTTKLIFRPGALLAGSWAVLNHIGAK